MGLLDSLTGQIAGQVAKQMLGGSGDNKLALSLLSSLFAQGGGVSGIFQKLQAGGLADALASWIGNGKNETVTPNALAGALGSDLLSKVAGLSGVNNDEASGVLAQYLPEMINKITPNGLAAEAEGFDLSDGFDMKDITALASKFLK